MIKTTTRPKPKATMADALRRTLTNRRAVVMRSREAIGGYHGLLKREGLRVRSRKDGARWLVWAERQTQTKRRGKR